MAGTIVLLCLKVFFGRVADVSLATVRMVLTVKEKSLWAALIGFLETGIWFLIVREALQADVPALWLALAYAAGFATGTFIGGKLSQRFIKGNVVVQIVTSTCDDELVKAIRKQGFAVSVVDVKGSEFGDEKYMLFSEICSTQLKELKELVHSMDEKAFVMVQETKYVFNGFIKQ